MVGVVRKKSSIQHLGFLFMTSAFVIAGGSLRADSSTITKHLPIVLSSSPNTAFGVGERLKFVIKYEFIGAGNATMIVEEGPVVAGRPTLHLESKAESNSFIDKIFKVRDLNSSNIDRQSLYSVHFHQNLREGGYHVIRNTAFDYGNGSYSFEKTRKGKTSQDSGSLDQPVHDMLSAFFYARTLALEPGKEYSITVFSDKTVYALQVKVFPQIEEIKVPAGKFKCLRVEPALVGDAIFAAKEGKMTIWMTNDARKMPVLVRSKVMIGAFDAELMEYTTGPGPGQLEVSK